MSDTNFNYKVEITATTIQLKINKMVVFDAKSRGAFLMNAYNIKDLITNKKYKLRCFRYSVIFWGEERIEFRNEHKEIIMKLYREVRRAGLFRNKFLVSEPQIGVSLEEVENNRILYITEDGEEITGFMEYYLDDYDYKLTTTKELKNPLYLIALCLSIKLLRFPSAI